MTITHDTFVHLVPVLLRLHKDLHLAPVQPLGSGIWWLRLKNVLNLLWNPHLMATVAHIVGEQAFLFLFVGCTGITVLDFWWYLTPSEMGITL